MTSRGISMAILLLGGCGTYAVNRAATAPHATPQLHSGMPVDGALEVGLGASSIANFTKPKVGDPADAVEIPGTQVHGDARLRVSDSFALGIIIENGLESTVDRPKGILQPPVENGDVTGYGLTGDFAIRTQDERLRVGLGFDIIVWDVPYVEYETCVSNCFPYDGFSIVEHQSDEVATFGASVTPSYHTGALTVFGGLTARQHPTIQQKGYETEDVFDDESDVESGPYNLLVSAGLEVAFGDGVVRGSVIAYQDVTQDPVKYGPGLAALVTIPIGRKPKAPAQAAPPPYAPPPPTYGPPAPYVPPAPPAPPPGPTTPVQ